MEKIKAWLDEKAQWIWENDNPQPDEYAEFYLTLPVTGGNTWLHLSADSNYACYVNGRRVYSGQYSDTPWNKIYDSWEITDYCDQPVNHLAIAVWYYGARNVSYCPGEAGLKFLVTEGEEVVACSDCQTLCRSSRCFVSHEKKKITGQLGYSFHYNAAAADGWQYGEGEGFHPAVRSGNNSLLTKRPCPPPTIAPAQAAVLCKTTGNGCIYDFGKEVSGLLQLSLTSDRSQTLTVCYGEHLSDGNVRRIIADRDFSFRLDVAAGENHMENPFRRFGCRYVELQWEAPVTVELVSIEERLMDIPVTHRLPIQNPLTQQIYDTCIRTLELCRGDHYEDCPWREQGLYVLDSRNQMLCGYQLSDSYEYPRSNLQLFAQNLRKDGLLVLTAPCEFDGMTIPSFSLHYFTAVWEYLMYSGDVDFVASIQPQLKTIMEAFVGRFQQNLVPEFDPARYWNFYEWTPNLCGGEQNQQGTSLVLNCLLVLALRDYERICQKLQTAFLYPGLAEKIQERIHQVFFDPERRLYRDFDTSDTVSELGNALAILCGAADDDTKCLLADRLTADDGVLTTCSLSMLGFKYDALLQADSAQIRYILSDIESKYGKMLQAGATSFWETEEGDPAFDNAGSLCHGWSAMPVYYYQKAYELGVEL